MDIDLIIAALKAHPQIQMLLQAIQPYLPVIMREGESLFSDFVSYAVDGKWPELDRAVWAKMTQEERDKLAATVLEEARDAVDNQFRRNKEAKKAAIQVATALLTALL